jgi:hypothetical protein
MSYGIRAAVPWSDGAPDRVSRAAWHVPHLIFWGLQFKYEVVISCLAVEVGHQGVTNPSRALLQPTRQSVPSCRLPSEV